MEVTLLFLDHLKEVQEVASALATMVVASALANTQVLWKSF